MTSALHRLDRGLRLIGLSRRKRPTGTPSRLGRGPHGVSAVAVIRQAVRTLRTRSGSTRRR